MVLYLFADERTITILDTLLYVSPIVIVQFLILSKALRLCGWHKTACSLPLIPQITVLLDNTFVSFSRHAAEYSVITMIIMYVLLLISAYKVFFCNERK